MSARKGGPMLPPDKQQEVLLKEIRLTHMGFSEMGRPVAAVVLYKALTHWKTFQVEKTNTFDRIVETFQVAERDGSTNVLSYWLSNTVTLYFLVQHVQPAAPLKANSMGFSIFGGGESAAGKTQGDAVDTMLFKVQLGMSVERLYITIRDAVKSDLLMVLNGSAAAVSALFNSSSSRFRSDP